MEGLVTSIPEETQKVEALKPNNIHVFITDHSADNESTGNRQALTDLYKDIAKDGVQSVRFDWRWRVVQPTNEEIDQTASGRYKEAVSVMKDVGLEEPTINLSSIPDWALKLYSTDKQAFLNAYGHYLDNVKQNLSEIPDVKISRFQVLNELNVSTYSPITDVNDVGKMCDMVREKFKEYNPDLKIAVSILAAEFPDVVKGTGFAKDVTSYLDDLHLIADKIDIVTIDYYPGSWQRPTKGKVDFLKKVVLPDTNAYKEMFDDMSLFKKVAETIASWEKEYDVGETGFPTKGMYWGDERRQRYFYDVFAKNLRHIMIDFKSRGINLPTRVGFYEAIDEEPMNIQGKILKSTIFPEFDWGMRKAGGQKKLILQGNLHEANVGESRLNEIVQYLKKPLQNPG